MFHPFLILFQENDFTIIHNLTLVPSIGNPFYLNFTAVVRGIWVEYKLSNQTGLTGQGKKKKKKPNISFTFHAGYPGGSNYCFFDCNVDLSLDIIQSPTYSYPPIDLMVNQFVRKYINCIRHLTSFVF